MPDFSPSPAGGPDGALAWYNRSLAKVLGLNPADPTLPADMLSQLSTGAQRKALGAVIDRRFRRRVDEVTGAVTMERAGDAFLLIEPDEDSDSETASLTTAYLGGAQAALASIDPSQALPGKCPTAVAGTIEQVRSTIATIIAEAPARRNRLQMLIHLDELTNVNDGLMRELTRMFGTTSDDPDSVGLERARKSIRLAQDMLKGFEEEMTVRSKRDRPSLAEIAEVVSSCGAHVSTHARNVRTALRDAGIGSCELRAVKLECATVMQASWKAFRIVTLDQGLQALETEPDRWPALIASGHSAGFASLRRSAERLKSLVEGMDPASILKSLGILSKSKTQSAPREAFALALAYKLERLCGYSLSILNVILREATLDPLSEDALETDDCPPGTGAQKTQGEAASGKSPSPKTGGNP